MKITLGGTQPSHVQLSVAGDLDLAVAKEFQDAAAMAASADACRDLVIDLSQVDFIDSTGIGALVSVRNSSLGKGIALHLRRPTPQVRRLIEIANLGAVFDISDV